MYKKTCSFDKKKIWKRKIAMCLNKVAVIGKVVVINKLAVINSVINMCKQSGNKQCGIRSVAIECVYLFSFHLSFI